MTKTFKQKLLAIILGMTLAVCVSYVSAMSRPALITSNPSEFINVGPATGAPIDQVKNGRLDAVALLIGYSAINSQGKLYVGSSAGINPSITSALNVDVGDNGLLGSIRSTDLSWSGGTTAGHAVCADTNGKLVLCTVNGSAIYGQGGSGNTSLYDTYIVPPGVSSLTVEVVGGGGAGYGTKNSPTTGFDDGETSYFISENISLISTGGTGAYKQNVPGTGGTASYTGSVSSVTNIAGTSGDSAPNGIADASLHSSGPFNCSGTNYYPIVGATGNVGADGAKAGNGSKASGGSGGVRGPLLGTEATGSTVSWTFLSSTACTNFLDKTSDELTANQVPLDVKFQRPGGNGADGVNGGGGGGFGGRGGASAFLESTSACNSRQFNCKSGLSASGGGSGAFISGTITVYEGQTFYIKAGGGGVPQNNSCTLSNCPYSQLGGGAVSGEGGDGYVKITY